MPRAGCPGLHRCLTSGFNLISECRRWASCPLRKSGVWNVPVIGQRVGTTKRATNEVSRCRRIGRVPESFRVRMKGPSVSPLQGLESFWTVNPGRCGLRLACPGLFSFAPLGQVGLAAREFCKFCSSCLNSASPRLRDTFGGAVFHPPFFPCPRSDGGSSRRPSTGTRSRPRSNSARSRTFM